MAQRGATKTRKFRDRNNEVKEVTHKVRPRESLRAMRIINAIGRLSLRQQRRDHKAKQHQGERTLNDCVTPDIPRASQLLTQEAKRQGLSCAAELDRPTRKALCAQARHEYIAAHGPMPQTGPKPLKETAPERRNDWVIPKETQAQIMTRLRDMVDPKGDEHQELRPREFLMAAEVLFGFCRLVDAQERFDMLVQTGGTPTDWEALDLELEEIARRRIEERKREDQDEEEPEK
jgi:hypothetical protein